MKNIELLPFKHASTFRRVAAVAWGPPNDPSIYGSVQVRSERLQAWLELQRAKTGARLTITHAVARALAITLRRHPDLNAMVRGGRLYLRRDVDVFLQVALPAEGGVGTTDLSGVLVRQADGKDVAAIAAELSAGAGRLKRGEDPEFKKTKDLSTFLPTFLFRWLLSFLTFLQYRLNLSPTFLGAPRDPFGSAMVTSLGMMGVTLGFAPFFPLGVAPVIVLVGAVEEIVAPVNGQPAVVRAFRLNATLDHRVIDGFHAALLSKEVQILLESPELLELSEGGGGGT